MARLHLINIHSSTVKVPTSDTDLRYGEIAVQYATSDPALYIKKADNSFAKFVPNIDISGSTSGSGNVVTGISVSNNTVTAAKGNVVDSATGDTIISATVSGGTKVVVSASTALNDAVTIAHTHGNQDVLDGITSGKVSNWDSAYTNMLTGVTHGTDGTFVTTTVGTKSSKTQSIGVSVTTAATSAATSSANGLATAYETKQYIDSKSGNIKNVTTIDGKTVSSSADTFSIATGNSLVTKSTTQSGANITTTIGITTGATTASTVGLAVNTDVKDYVDKAVTAATITGDGIVIGASGLNVSHKTYSVTNTAKTASPAHGGTFVAISDAKYDGYGHVTAATATTVTLPSETQLSTGSTGSGNVVTGITVNNHQVTKVMGYAVTSASGDDYISANTNNGALSVSLKSVIGSGNDLGNVSATGSVADAKAIKEYVDSQVTSSVNYKGATATLPASATSATGDLYIASAQIAIPAESSASGSATTAETGDYLICREQGKWDVIEKNLTGAVTTNTTLTTNRLVVGNGSKTVKLAPASGSTTQGIYIKTNGEVALTNRIHDVAATGTTSAASALTWNTESTLGNINIDGTDYTIKVKMPANPNTDTATTETGHYGPTTSAETKGSTTGNNYIRGIQIDSKGHIISVSTGTPVDNDTKVTSAANHYTPTGTTGITATTGYAVGAIKMDAKGHVTGIEDSAHKVEKDVPSDAVFTDTKVTSAANHYTGGTAATTAGTASTFIKQIVLDGANHVVSVTTGSPAGVNVVDCAQTITTASTTLGTIDGAAITAKIGVTNSGATVPVNSANATTIATVGGVNITEKVSMQSLAISGANDATTGITFDGTSAITITTLDCGTY